MYLAWVGILSLALIVGTTALHYEGREVVRSAIKQQNRPPRRSALAILISLIGLHVVEIGAYALAYRIATAALALGRFHGQPEMLWRDYLYFAAENLYDLGYGDIYPVGDLRLLASIEPLNGLLLLAWSGAVLFSLVQELAPARR